MLELKQVSRVVAGNPHIADVSMTLEKGTVNVLLGPTLAGKTSLMRLMAGLDRPTAGDIVMDGKSVVGMPVQQRNVAMVYQQFINYPALSVYENIASPLRVQQVDKSEIDKRVRHAAELLHLTAYLDRLPVNLSGGQQQRTAIARALVKNATLVLLDEPLANLDYKLREELRAELPKVFAASGAIFVYATTEPSEALLLGGKTATLHQGRVTQFSRTIEVYSRPADLVTAQTFSDPPLNTIALAKQGGKLIGAQGFSLPLPAGAKALADGNYTVAFRPHHVHIDRPSGNCVPVRAHVAITELTGSESFIHVDVAGTRWVALTHGVRDIPLGSTIDIFLDPNRFFLFDAAGRLAAAPQLARAA